MVWKPLRGWVTGHAELQVQAARISDARVRQGFLSNVPHNREIVRAWEALQ